MSKLNDKLELLSPSPRFFDKQRRNQLKDQSSQPINTFFLQKREMLEADDFTELPLKRLRGISDAIIPDNKILTDSHFFNSRRRRSTLLGFQEPPNLPLDQLDMLAAEIRNEGKVVEEPKPVEKPKTRKRKEQDGFDFDEFTNKKNKETKFVMKLDKSSDNLKINDKGKTRGRKRKVNDDTVSLETFTRTENCLNEDDPDRKQSGFVDEKQRLKAKINKVNLYWDKRSLHIPNVFRLARLIEEDAKNLLEFQDYSKKSVLVQGVSQRDKSEGSNRSTSENFDMDNDALSFVQRRSFNLILGVPDEMMSLLK